MLRDEYETKFVPRAQYEIVRLALTHAIEGCSDVILVQQLRAALRKAEEMEL